MSSTLITSFDFYSNFWVVNPYCGLIDSFKELKDSDKSKDKNNSSNIMWALVMLLHPGSPVTANMSYKDKLNFINTTFLDKIKLDPEGVHLNLVRDFEKFGITRLQRIAKDWGDKLDERFYFLKTISYTLDNAKELDEMMGRTDRLWKQYITCLKDLEQESIESKTQGDALESLIESGKI